MRIEPNEKNDGVILHCTTDDAVRLEALLGRLSGNAQRMFGNLYDHLADVLEASGQIHNISREASEYTDKFDVVCKTYGNPDIAYMEIEV